MFTDHISFPLPSYEEPTINGKVVGYKNLALFFYSTIEHPVLSAVSWRTVNECISKLSTFIHLSTAFSMRSKRKVVECSGIHYRNLEINKLCQRDRWINQVNMPFIVFFLLKITDVINEIKNEIHKYNSSANWSLLCQLVSPLLYQLLRSVQPLIALLWDVSSELSSWHPVLYRQHSMPWIMHWLAKHYTVMCSLMVSVI